MNFLAAPDYQTMSRRAANFILAQVILFPDSVLGLATGSTPLGVYSQLVDWYDQGDIDFSAVKTVNLDEYCGLAPEHEQSYNYYMKSNFLVKLTWMSAIRICRMEWQRTSMRSAGAMMRSSTHWGH